MMLSMQVLISVSECSQVKAMLGFIFIFFKSVCSHPIINELLMLIRVDVDTSVSPH